jgi:hypothetical protein
LSNITSLRYFSQEDEILFMIASIFRLVLFSDDDYQLKPLFEYMKKLANAIPFATKIYN